MVPHCLTFILHYTHHVLCLTAAAALQEGDEQGRLCWWPPPNQDTEINLCPGITANMEIKSITLE